MSEGDGVHYSAGGVSFVGYDAVHLYRAKLTKVALRAHQRTGLMVTRGATKRRLLDLIQSYTGKIYKRTQVEAALQDLEQWIVACEAAMPVTVDGVAA